MRIRSGSRARIGWGGLVGSFALALAGLGADNRSPAQAQPAVQIPAPRNAQPGLTASVGAGAAYANLGAQLSFQLPLRAATAAGPGPWWALSAGAALGRWSGDDGRRTVDGEGLHGWGSAFAIGASFGQRHRISADLGYGVLSSQPLAIEGLVVDEVARYGAFAQAGYEFLGENGLFVRLLPLGVGYVPNPLLESQQRRSWIGSVGVGWKLW